MEIIKEFGVDPILLAAQIVNFLIILFIFKRFLYKPILNILQKREETIKEGLKKAEEAQILYEKTAEKEKELLKKAQKEASLILGEAKKEAQVIMEQNESKIKQQTEKMIKEAQAQIQDETRKAQKMLTENISKLAIAFLEKSLKGIFSPKDQEEVIARAIKKIK
jgi:F-type H+-transporting ATPase subunit b